MIKSIRNSLEAAFFEFIKRSFAERRKTLANNLSSAFSDCPREKVQEALIRLGASPAARAETPPRAQFAELFRHLRTGKR